jgi:putative flippase GtrA
MYKFIKRLFQNKLIRFFLVGGLNTVVNYILFVLLIWVGIPYAWALLIGIILAILFNFKTYGHLVFHTTSNRLLFRFIIVYGILYLFNYAGLRICLSAGLNAYIGGAILAIPTGLLGFLLNKRFVFPKKNQPAGAAARSHAPHKIIP